MEICIIGFGHAGKAYTEAFKGVINEAKISIIDTDPTVFIPEHYSKLDDISGLIFDVIVIATPPKTHLNVLASILNHARRIIIEKPICIEISQYEEIMLLARKSNKIYFAFHALFGKELSLIDFATATSAARSIEVSHIFFDPYNQAGKDALGGAFWDSIYNVVSVFYAFFDDYLSVESIAITVDRFDHFEASIDYVAAEKGKRISQNISIRWDLPVNLKVSQIRADDAGYIVNHSMQSIAKIDGIGHDFLPFQNGRLVDHYSGVVEDALSSDTLNENNERATNFSKIIWELDDARRRTES